MKKNNINISIKFFSNRIFLVILVVLKYLILQDFILNNNNLNIF